MVYCVGSDAVKLIVVIFSV